MADNYNSENSSLPGKLPPQNLEAEKSLLGALMLDKNAIIKVADFLKSSDFYKRIHQEIYQATLDLFEKNEPVDLLAVSTRLKEKELLENIGGNSYLTELINTVPTAAHVSNYAKIVQRKRILRDLIEAGQEINSIGHNEKEDVDMLLDKAEQRIFSIAQKSMTQNFFPIKEGLEEAFERLEKLSKHQGGIRGIPTGFKDLDNILAGFQKSDLIILAARPSMGKSALALNIAANIAINQKTPVGMFSLEMSNDQIIDRLIAGHSNVDLWKLRTGRLSSEGDDNDFTRIQHTLGMLSEAPLYIDDAASSNVLQMRAMARRLQAERGLSLIIIDYLQLMESRNPSANIVQQVTEISRSLKGLARELNVPVLALSQLSRAVEQRTPQIPRLADLRESGSLEQDADVVLFIYREDRYREDTTRKNIADIIVAKHRNGPIGKVELYFDDQRVTFRNLEKEEYGEQ
jgi:replicative DNA helicase